MTAATPTRRVNQAYLRLMRAGFDAETIKRMEFLKVLISKGVYSG